MKIPPSPAQNPMPAVNSLSGRRLPANLPPQVDRSKVDPDILKAAEGMEAMFLDYLMKTMRETVPKTDMDLESPATNIYRGMLDSEFAQRAAKNGGVGLAEPIIAYLQSQRYNSYVAPAARQAPQQPVLPVQGGTDEGQSTANQ